MRVEWAWPRLSSGLRAGGGPVEAPVMAPVASGEACVSGGGVVRTRCGQRGCLR